MSMKRRCRKFKEKTTDAKHIKTVHKRKQAKKKREGVTFSTLFNPFTQRQRQRQRQVNTDIGTSARNVNV